MGDTNLPTWRGDIFAHVAFTKLWPFDKSSSKNFAMKPMVAIILHG
jgi:hypothetical protein